MFQPHPYASMTPRAAAVLVLDELIYQLAAQIPDTAREGLLALTEGALTASKAGEIDDARTILHAIKYTLTRQWAGQKEQPR